MRRTTSALLLLALGLCAGCGESPAPRAPETVQWRASKPHPTVGRLEAAVVERPAPDRARIEARWTSRPGATSCMLEIVLPDGVLIVDGQARLALPPDADAGTAAWTVEFPTGRALDAVLRLCAQVEGAQQGCEVTVRLETAP